MVSVSQPALAPQCSVSVNLFSLVAIPCTGVDAGPAACWCIAPRERLTNFTNAFSFPLTPLSVVFVSFSMCMWNLYVCLQCCRWLRQTFRNIFACFCRKSRPHRSGSAAPRRSHRVWFAAATTIFLCMFICLVDCAYLVHIMTVVACPTL